MDGWVNNEEVEEEYVPYMPSEVLAAGENRPTVTKALALKRFCWCGAIAFVNRIARTVRVGSSSGSIDGRDMA